MEAQANGKFALQTDVSAEKSLSEIRSTLKKYDATGFMMIENVERIGIAFEIQKRQIRFVMPMPPKSEAVWKASSRYHHRGEFDVKLHDQMIRSRWRALAMVIKAKLESVALGVETLDEAFMGQLVLPSGQTMAEWATPKLDAVYAGGDMPPMLPTGR